MILINNIVKKTIVNEVVENVIVNEIKGINFSGVSFLAPFSGVDFTNSDFSNCTFRTLDLRNSNFTNCNFANIILSPDYPCNWQNTNLTGVKNMPVAYNTKAKFLQAIGVSYPGLNITWIDGTSIMI